MWLSYSLEEVFTVTDFPNAHLLLVAMKYDVHILDEEEVSSDSMQALLDNASDVLTSNAVPQKI